MECMFRQGRTVHSYGMFCKHIYLGIGIGLGIGNGPTSLVDTITHSNTETNNTQSTNKTSNTVIMVR